MCTRASLLQCLHGWRESLTTTLKIITGVKGHDVHKELKWREAFAFFFLLLTSADGHNKITNPPPFTLDHHLGHTLVHDSLQQAPRREGRHYANKCLVPLIQNKFTTLSSLIFRHGIVWNSQIWRTSSFGYHEKVVTSLLCKVVTIPKSSRQ